MKAASRAKNSFIYAIGSIFNVASGLLVIPLITHALNTAEYGQYEILMRIASILIIFTYLGCRQSYIRFYYQKNDDTWRKSLAGTMISILFITSLATLSIMIYLKDLIIEILLDGDNLTIQYYLMLTWVPVDLFFNLGMANLIIREKAVVYVITSIFRTVFYLTLVYFALYHAEFGLKGIFLANIVATGLIAICFIISFISWSRLAFSLEILKELLRFGLPILPATIFAYIFMSADRYFLSIYSSLSQVGIYALAAKLGFLAIAFLQEPFTKVWSPLVFKSYEQPDGRRIISEAFELYVSMNFIAVLAISIFAPFYLPFLVSAEFMQSVKIIPLCAFAASIYGIACIADVGILISKRTEFKLITNGIAAMGTITANIILVPIIGPYGAALASIIGLSLLLITTITISNHFYMINVNWNKLSNMLILMIVIYLLGASQIEQTSNPWAILALGVMTLLAYVVVVLIPGIMPNRLRCNLIEKVSYLKQIIKLKV